MTTRARRACNLLAAGAAAALILLTGCAGSDAETAPAVTPVFPFHLPARGSRALFLGDSWTYGLFASPRTRGYAYLSVSALGLSGEVRGAPGTGYLNPGPSNATYAERLARLPQGQEPALVVVQGSYNDAAYPETRIESAERSTLAQVRRQFGAAQIVVLGTGSPAPAYDNRVHPGGVSVDELDRLTRAAARAERLNYVSPISGRWFTVSNAPTMLTGGRLSHPTNAGHALFARRFVADLHALAAGRPAD